MLGPLSNFPLDASVAHLALQLNEQYPGDVGVLTTPSFTNFFELDRRQVIYIGADEVHAYLEGVLNCAPSHIIECMAVSDNVLNAAFVPLDARNTSIFVNALTYTAREPSAWVLPTTSYKCSQNGRATAFEPPLDEFTVMWTQLNSGGGTGEEQLGAGEGLTIGLVLRGSVQAEEQPELAENGRKVIEVSYYISNSLNV